MTTKSKTEVCYLDLGGTRKASTKLYKNPGVRSFQIKSSIFFRSIPSCLSYGVYISQLINMHTTVNIIMASYITRFCLRDYCNRVITSQATDKFFQEVLWEIWEPCQETERSFSGMLLIYFHTHRFQSLSLYMIGFVVTWDFSICLLGFIDIFLLLEINDNDIFYTKLYESVVISTLTSSTFHSCQVMHHLAIYMVFTFHSLSHLQDAAHIMITMDILINFWCIDSFLRFIMSID